MKRNISFSRQALENEAQFKAVLTGFFKSVEFVPPENIKSNGGIEGDLISRNVQRLYDFIIKGKEAAIPVADTYQFKSFAMMIRVYNLDGFRFVVNSDKSRIYSYDELKGNLDQYDRLAFYNMVLERNLSVSCEAFLNEKTEKLLAGFTNDLRSLIKEVQFINSVLEFRLYELLYKTVIHNFFNFHKGFLLIKNKDEVIDDIVASEVSIDFHAYHIEKSLKVLERSLDGFRINREPANAIYRIKSFLSYHIDNFIHYHLKEHFYYDKAISPYIHLFNAFLNRINEKYKDPKTSAKAGQPSQKNTAKKGPQLETDQIVLLLDRAGFFNDKDIGRLADTQKAEIIALMTGRNENNIKNAIENLAKRSSRSGGKYQRDMKKIDRLLKDPE